MARVLVIEDDGALRYDLSEELTAWGYEVVLAADGNAGLRAIQDSQPDLVLCDIMMPCVSGFELLEKLKDSGMDYGDMSFLFISARTIPEMVVQGIRIGADDYITKPLDFFILKAKIESHISKRRELINRAEVFSVYASTWSGSIFALAFAVAATGLGLAGFMIVYWFKTVLGINIFEDIHLSDFWT